MRKDISNYGRCFNAESIRSLKCVHLAWHLNGSKVLFTVIQDPLEHLMKIQGAICVKHEHIRLAADMHRHSPLAETLSKRFVFKYSSWTRVLRSTFIKWIPKASPVRYTVRNRPQECLSSHLSSTVFACYSCLYQENANSRLFFAM